MRSTPPQITLVKGTEKERQTQEQLLRLFERYPLDKWRYTEKVRIEEGVIPHSHPVLTLNTRHIDDPEQLLGTYIHEQIHWFCSLAEKNEQLWLAMEEFREMYPGLPVKLPEGCGDEISNYLHFPVNYLECLGLSELLGATEARKVIGRITHYTKIYELVLKDNQRIGEVITRYGLIPPERPPKKKVFIEVT